MFALKLQTKIGSIFDTYKHPSLSNLKRAWTKRIIGYEFFEAEIMDL